MGGCLSAPSAPGIQISRLPGPFEEKASALDGGSNLTDAPVVAKEDDEASKSTVDGDEVSQQVISEPPAVQPGQPWNWTRGPELGRGAYGTVFLGILNDNGRFMAVKQVETPHVTEETSKRRIAEAVKELESEVRLLQQVYHPNIVRYYGTERTEHHINIFLEWVPGGSIRKLLDGFGPFAEPVVKMYTREVLLGLRYLHHMKIMHRDIKGQNVLVDTHGNVKLSDFGASTQIQTVVGNSKPVDDGNTSVKGTPYFMAPEVVRGTGHGRPADIWSLGCLVVEMFTGRAPWIDQLERDHNWMSAMIHITVDNNRPTSPPGLSREGQAFLELCWDRNAATRADCDRLLAHPFITSAPSVQKTQQQQQQRGPQGRGQAVSPTLEERSAAQPASRSRTVSGRQAGLAATAPLNRKQPSPPALLTRTGRRHSVESDLIQPALGPQALDARFGLQVRSPGRPSTAGPALGTSTAPRSTSARRPATPKGPSAPRRTAAASADPPLEASAIRAAPGTSTLSPTAAPPDGTARTDDFFDAASRGLTPTLSGSGADGSGCVPVDTGVAPAGGVRRGGVPPGDVQGVEDAGKCSRPPVVAAPSERSADTVRKDAMAEPPTAQQQALDGADAEGTGSAAADAVSPVDAGEERGVTSPLGPRRDESPEAPRAAAGPAPSWVRSINSFNPMASFQNDLIGDTRDTASSTAPRSGAKGSVARGHLSPEQSVMMHRRSLADNVDDVIRASCSFHSFKHHVKNPLFQSSYAPTSAAALDAASAAAPSTPAPAVTGANLAPILEGRPAEDSAPLESAPLDLYPPASAAPGFPTSGALPQSAVAPGSSTHTRFAAAAAGRSTGARQSSIAQQLSARRAKARPNSLVDRSSNRVMPIRQSAAKAEAGADADSAFECEMEEMLSQERIRFWEQRTSKEGPKRVAHAT